IPFPRNSAKCAWKPNLDVPMDQFLTPLVLFPSCHLMRKGDLSEVCRDTGIICTGRG
ncbi:hypothetical protein WG66_001059, partial [Moniliophthora roreri]